MGFTREYVVVLESDVCSRRFLDHNDRFSPDCLDAELFTEKEAWNALRKVVVDIEFEPGMTIDVVHEDNI